MIDSIDKQTLDNFQPSTRRRGRPSTGQAKTRAEIQRDYRQRLKTGQVQQLPSVSSIIGNDTENTESLQLQLGSAHKEIAQLHIRIKELQEKLKFTEISFLGERDQLQRERAENEKLRLEIVQLSKQKHSCVTKKGEI